MEDTKMTNIKKNNYTFSGYAFDVTFYDLAVAIYKNEKGDAVCRVEKNGEIESGYSEQTYSERLCPDGVEYRLVSDFVTNENDIHTNQARALSEVLSAFAQTA